MNKNFFKHEFPFWIIIIIPFIVLIFTWDKIPDKVPLHWNISNEVDSWGDKSLGMLIAPCLNLIFYFLFLLLPRIDPRSKNYSLFKGTYWMLRLGISIFIFILFFVTLLAALGNSLNIGLIVIYSTILLFMFMGNAFSRIRTNYFIGIRTPWTLQSKTVWTKTHRLAAHIWFWASLILIPLGFLIELPIFSIIYFIYIGILVIIPVVYSYVIFNNLKKLGLLNKDSEFEDESELLDE